MNKSAIILAGGFSRRFGSDKGVVLLKNKPLVRHVIDNVSPVVDEILVVVSSQLQKKTFNPIVGENVNLIIDNDDSQSPLIGTLTGLTESNGDYSLLLPCDAPMVSTNLVQLLFDISERKNAVIPKWPSGYLEPLQAIYRTQPALDAAKKALGHNHLDMRSMIKNLKEVRYISTIALQQVDPELISFFNVNTLQDLKKLESRIT